MQADSRTMNPNLAASLIAEATEDDPEAAAAEWLGQFRSDLESYVSTAVLDACTTPGVVERPVVSGVTYVGFIDGAAGSGRDSFAAAIAHADLQPDGQAVAVLDAVREVKPPFDPVAVTGELGAFLQTYGVDVVQADKLVARGSLSTEVSSIASGHTLHAGGHDSRRGACGRNRILDRGFRGDTSDQAGNPGRSSSRQSLKCDVRPTLAQSPPVGGTRFALSQHVPPMRRTPEAAGPFS